MFTSKANVFRTRQSIADLQAFAASASHDTLSRIAVGRPSTVPRRGARSLEYIVQNDGCRFLLPQDEDMQSALKLAAALPDDDFPAFVLATVIALADVLQRDSVDDDLFWNWDAFHAHYGLVDADARAVLMNGFRVIDRTGLTRLDPPPDAGMCYTHSFADVTRALEGSSSNRLVQAIHEDISPEDAGDLWENADKVLLSTGETMAFRYLAERPKGMAPPNAETVALLPPQM